MKHIARAAVGLICLSPTLAQAEKEPIYSAVNEQPDRCAFDIMSIDRDKLISFHMSQGKGLLFITMVLTSDPRFTTKNVRLMIDDREIMQLDVQRKASQSMTAGVKAQDPAAGLAMMKAIAEAAPAAKHMRIVSPTAEVVLPIDGLEKATGDYLSCLREKQT